MILYEYFVFMRTVEDAGPYRIIRILYADRAYKQEFTALYFLPMLYAFIFSNIASLAAAHSYASL